MRTLHYLLLLPLAALAAEDTIAELSGQSVKAVIDTYREQGYPFAYSTQLIDASMLVADEPEATTPVAIVREILAPFGLGLRTEADVHFVVRRDRAEGDAGRLLLILTDARDNQPVQDAIIAIQPTVLSREMLKPGMLEFDDIEPGRYLLEVQAEDLQTIKRTVDVWPGQTQVVELSMAVERPAIELIEVSASRYEISRDISTSSYSLDQHNIQMMPDFGEDPLRSVQRLPGAAASGASAKTHLRGGAEDEVGIMLNGQKLFDPFHIRDYQSIFSVIDSRAIEGVEVYTGGFPVQYGNRMSGMILMDTLETVDRRHTELGLSVYSTSMLFAGSEGDKRWLLSARRGNLDLIIDNKFGSPSYYDVFAEFAWEPNPDLAISFNALFADDRIELILESDPEELERVVSDTRSAEFWVQIDNQWSDTLSSQTVLSATSFDNLRRGTMDDEESIIAAVYDDRQITQFGFRQDFSYHPSDRHFLRWGLQLRPGSADYDYRSVAEYFELQSLFVDRDELVVSAITASPEGAGYALYFADRWVLSPSTRFEWGLRWDDQTYIDQPSDSQISPRISLLQILGDNTEVRVSWGRYHQSQEINELQVEDGISHFWPAQQADHFIAGVRHAFGDQYALRVELYHKQIHNVRPRFENLFNPLGLLPELQPDRIRLDPTSAATRGIEISFDSHSGPMMWWATYVLSEATDRINGRDQQRSWDQRHAFQGGLSFSNEKWDWAIAASVHSGWPTTELLLLEDGVDDDGEPDYIAVPTPRNTSQYSTFASLDVRVARKWKMPRGRLTAFLEITNLTNRRNECCLDWDLLEDEDSGEVSLERGVDYWMPIIPAVGVLWEF